MARTLRNIALAILLATAGSVVVGGGLSPADSSPPSGRGSIRANTEAEQAAVDWAIGRFEAAGLVLPELQVRFDPSRDECNNAEGLYHRAPDGERTVTVCAPAVDTYAAELQRRRTLLHEFAHAWDDVNLSSADHEHLSVILGADAWNDPEADWEERGVERLAETFVFSLLDQPRRPLKIVIGCNNALEAFRTATGAEPLGPGVPRCGS